MGIEILAYAALAVSAYSAVESASAQKEAAAAQRKAQSEQKAINASQAAAERRQQIREERIKRAKIVQASTNTGVTDSSGEAGSTSSLSTQLGSNVGQNLGTIQSMNNISNYQQQAANAMTDAADWNAIGSVSQSIFGATSGSIFKGSAATPNSGTNFAPVETATPWKVG